MTRATRRALRAPFAHSAPIAHRRKTRRTRMKSVGVDENVEKNYDENDETLEG